MARLAREGHRMMSDAVRGGKKRIVIAIDGPAGAGKSTIAKRLAEKLGFLYIDTGAMYRAVGLWALRAGVALDDVLRLEQLAREARIELRTAPARVSLNGEDVTEAIRSPDVSAVPGVRHAMVDKQRQMAFEACVVMEGRDIGSVVFPDAEVKVFLDADPGVRAERRLRELREGTDAPVPEQVVREIEERDRRDRNRATSPLTQAPEAAYVDSTHLSLDEVERIILELVRNRISNGKELLR
jgi:cytidylate kinase